MHEVFGDQVVLAAISTWLIEKLKGSKWFPLASEGAERLNKIFAAAVAALATAGIMMSAGWDAAAHTFTFTVANLDTSNVATFLYHGVGQYIYMKFAYKGMKLLRSTNGTVAP